MTPVAVALGLLILSAPATTPSQIARDGAAASARAHRHEFTPSVFHHQFSPVTPPALAVSPGDTIHTTTLDASGVDERGQHRAKGGNPQTGPFYVAGAMPGDTLAVHIVRLRLNRGW